MQFDTQFAWPIFSLLQTSSFAQYPQQPNRPKTKEKLRTPRFSQFAGLYLKYNWIFFLLCYWPISLSFFSLAPKRNKLLNQCHNHTNAHMTTTKNIDFTNIGKVADQNDILLCNRKLIESNFLTKRFMSATASKIKHRKMKKNPTCGNGFNGRSFLSFLYSPIESMKIEPKSSSPIIITITRSKECCTV